MRHVLGNITHICTQTETDAQRFRELGALPDRVTVTGNLKFDGQLPQIGGVGRRFQEILAEAKRGPVFLAGSTMRGEESLVLQAWKAIQQKYGRAILILAPRHPGRFEEVAGILDAQQLSFVRRTSFSDDSSEFIRRLAAADVILLDTIGELAEICGIVDVVFVGGSLVPTGGHNVIEPAFWGKPILFGPHMNNFRDVAGLFLKAEGAIQVADADKLAEACTQLLNHPGDARAMGERAKNVVTEQAGATLRVLAQMEAWLDKPNAPVTPAHSTIQ